MMRRRPLHCFVGRVGDRLVWEARIPNDSRVDQISCPAEWFYAQMIRPAPESTS